MCAAAGRRGRGPPPSSIGDSVTAPDAPDFGKGKQPTQSSRVVLANLVLVHAWRDTYGTVIDDDMGDEVRVTVIAAGFDRWDDKKPGGGRTSVDTSSVFGDDADDDLDIEGDDDFDVPSFLK